MQRLSPLIQRSSACLQPLQLSTRPTFFSTSTGPISARPSATPGINPVSLKTPPTAGSEVTDLTRIEASNPEYFHRTITARLREPSKRARNKVRKSGWIPSVFQGRGKYPNYVVQVDPKPFDRDYKAKYFTFERHVKWMLTGPLYELRIERGGLDEYGDELDVSHIPFERVRVLAHGIGIHPMSNKPIGLQFKYAPEDESVRLRIPIFPLNEDTAPGVQDGGYLNEFFREVDVRVEPFCKPPLFANIDVGHLEMKQRITLADLTFEGRDEGVYLIKPDSTTYAMVSKV